MMETKFDKFNSYANIAASICAVSGVLYIFTFAQVFISTRQDATHTFAVWAMIVSYNVAVVFRTMFRMGRPKTSERAWKTIQIANILAALLLVLELVFFFSSGRHEFVTVEDARVFILFPLYLVQQIMRSVVSKTY